MSKKKKRLQKMRQNKRNVSYGDYSSVLEDYGYVVQSGKGSHRKAICNIDDRTWTIIFVEPHGNKKSMNHKAVQRLLDHIEEIEGIANEDE